MRGSTTTGAGSRRGTAIAAEASRLERRSTGRLRLQAEIRHGRLVLLRGDGAVVHRAATRASPGTAGDDP